MSGRSRHQSSWPAASVTRLPSRLSNVEPPTAKPGTATTRAASRATAAARNGQPRRRAGRMSVPPRGLGERTGPWTAAVEATLRKAFARSQRFSAGSGNNMPGGRRSIARHLHGGWPAVALLMTLSLPPDELRALGHRVVDALVDHVETLPEQPPIRTGDAAALDAVLREPVPEEPGDAGDALDVLLAEVLPYMQHGDHPRFFARVPSPSNPVSALADAVGAAFNAFAGSWAGGSGPAALELVVLDWIRSLCGLPAGGEGILLSGGSVSSLTALAASQRRRLIVSDQTHASVVRAGRVLGMEVEVVASGADFRMPADAAASAVDSDACVVATAGTTNTGAIDPLAELAALCRERGAWLHVDGAYGALAALTPRGRALLAGLEGFDSLALDPHKWLFQPYECGCLLVREADALTRTFHMAPEYLRDVLSEEVNFRDRGPQLTRGSRALKVWLSLKTFGAAAFRAGAERGMALAERAEERLRAAGFEIVTPASLAIVTFAAEDPDGLAAAMVADGYAAPSTT